MSFVLNWDEVKWFCEINGYYLTSVYIDNSGDNF